MSRRVFSIVGLWCISLVLTDFVLYLSPFSQLTLAAFINIVPVLLFQYALLAILYALVYRSHRIFKVIIWLVSTIVVALNAFSYEYLAILGRLPDLSIVYYIVKLPSLIAENIISIQLLVSFIILIVTKLIVLLFLVFRIDQISESWPLPGYINHGIFVLASICGMMSIINAVNFIDQRKVNWLRIDPIFWYSYSSWQSAIPTQSALSENELRDLRQALGKDTELIWHQDYPLCRESNVKQPINANEFESTFKKPSITLLILEGVGMAEMKAIKQGKPVMPHLQNIAAKHLSFSQFKAVGTKSRQSLPAILSGIGPQQAAIFWREPLNRFAGLPQIFNTLGYQTGYFHGGDLSFEQQRAYLTMIGFQQIDELSAEDHEFFLGWGYADEKVFKKLKQTIEITQRPYIYTLFTLSTHFPYIIPKNAITSTELSNYEAALNYLDKQIGDFYDWHQQRDDGSLLLITADHVPHERNAENHRQGRPLDFDVPFIIVGMDQLDDLPDDITQRIGSHQDIAATIQDLIQFDLLPCHWGQSLVADDFPASRVVAAIDGEDYQSLYLWQN